MNFTLTNKGIFNTCTMIVFSYLLMKYNHLDIHFPIKMLLYIGVLAIVNMTFYYEKTNILYWNNMSQLNLISTYASLSSCWYTIYFLTLFNEHNPNNFAILFMYSISLAGSYWLYRLIYVLFTDYIDNETSKDDKKPNIQSNKYIHMNETELQCEYTYLMKTEKYFKKMQKN